MKKISATVFLLFLFITVSFSQKLYSKENLEKASQEDLFLYLTKAQKLKKAGGVLLIAAPISATTGILLSKHAWSGGTQGEWVLGAGLILASAGVTLVGIPVRITGSTRVKRISKIWNTKYNVVLIDLAPCSLCNYQTQNIQAGIKLTIRF